MHGSPLPQRPGRYFKLLIVQIFLCLRKIKSKKSLEEATCKLLVTLKNGMSILDFPSKPTDETKINLDQMMGCEKKEVWRRRETAYDCLKTGFIRPFFTALVGYWMLGNFVTLMLFVCNTEISGLTNCLSRGQKMTVNKILRDPLLIQWSKNEG